MSLYRKISPSCLPMRCPLMSTITWSLLLDRLAAPTWVCALVAALYGALWVAWLGHVWSDDVGEVPGFGIQRDAKPADKE